MPLSEDEWTLLLSLTVKPGLFRKFKHRTAVDKGFRTS